MNKSLYIGLMSGTSLDAIDVALCRFTEQNTSIIAFQAYPLPEKIRNEVSAFSHSKDVNIELLAALDIKLGRLFSEATLGILKSTNYDPVDIAAIGSHGQTIRHKPKTAETAFPFSLQIGDPNTIAEKTGITTSNLKEYIDKGELYYDHFADKSNPDKFSKKIKLEKNNNLLPKFILENEDIYKEWLA